MDIRRFFGVQLSKSGIAGTSKTTESSAKVKGSSEKSRKTSRSEKGSNNKKRKTSKTSESDDEEPTKNRKDRKHIRKKSKNALDSDSSEEEPLPPKLRKTSGELTKSTKNNNVAVISSDEEDALPGRLKKAPQAKEPSKMNRKETSTKKSPVKVIQNVSEYFGTKPVERTMRKIHALKRKERSEESSGLEKEREVINVDNNVKDNAATSVINSSKKQISPEQPSKKAKITLSDTKLMVSPSKKATLEKEKHKQSSDAAELKKQKSLQSDSVVKSLPNKSPEKSTSKSSPAVKSTPTSKHTPTKSNAEPAKAAKPKSTPVKSDEKAHDIDVVPSSLERKSSGYRSFMMREGPQALGSKEIPKGSETCLAGLVFVVTGVLESIERDDVQDLIKGHGGKVTQSVSKKTSYLVVGRDPGASKLGKAKQLGTKQLDEDGLFDMIRSSSNESSKSSETPSMSNKWDSPDKPPLSSSKVRTASQTSADFSPSQGCSQSSLLSSASSTPATQTPSASPLARGVEASSLLWVDKYSPKSIKQIIGQQGDKSNVKKLLRWLQNWHANQKAGKPKGGYFAGKEDGSIFKAALLSGPPGVGKTTSAQLVCKESGFSFVEFNASDSRSKKTLEEHVSELLGNRTMDGYLLASGPKVSSQKHVLIMDEVDGMAGNEDRGGMQELITLIKSTKIPIICMCNDRNSQKVRSLANYCFDLRFQRPRLEQIKGAMMGIAFKENLQIAPPAMEKVIVGANHDIRQVLHNLSMWTSKQKSMNYDEAKADASRAQKDIKMGPFDVTRKIFAADESSKMSMQEYFSLFFNDYSLIPLFSQENYINVVPFSAGGDMKKILKSLSDAAESFCDSDLVEKCIRSRGSWNLLPLQSFFSCVLPGKIMKGRLNQRIDFPSWLGKNSTTGKNSRILQDILSHTHLSTSGSKLELNMDYIPHLRKALSFPLINANSENCSSKVSEVIKVMDSYHLLKEDWESILEIGQFDDRPKLQSGIDSKVKSAFTRAYNKESHLAPYSSQTTSKKKAGRTASALETDDLENNEHEDENNSDDDDIEHNPMIKVKKPPKAGGSGRGKKGATNQRNSSAKEAKGFRSKGASKGKGKGKGKGK